MKIIIPALVIAWLLPTSTMAADGPGMIETYSWQVLAEADQLLGGTVVEDDSLGPVLRIEHTGDQPVMTLLEIENPAITSGVYGIEGRVRYEGVSEQGFLELWNHFPGGGAYFSRTLDVSGPMQSLMGTSGWREFSVPFSLEADPSTPPPSRLQFNLVLPKGGTVWLSDVSLKQVATLSAATTPPGAWWSNRTAGYVGAILGTTLGLLGAVIGILAGMGRSRRLMTSLLVLVFLMGVVCLVAGIIAVIAGQSSGVYYPLLLCGVIVIAALGGSYPGMRKSFEQMELRRMQAADA